MSLSVFQDNNALLQPKFPHLFIREMPHFLVVIPGSSSLSDLPLDAMFIRCNPNIDDGVSRKTTIRRKPRHFFLNQFNRFKPPFPNGIIPVTDRDETVAIFLDQFFGAFLSRLKG